MTIDKNLILICGDEDYLKEQKKNELLKELNCADSMNFNAFSEETIDLNEISSLMHTMPFMEDRRTLLIDNSGFFTGNVPEDTVETFSDVPDTAVVIFYEKKADRGNPMYKLISKFGSVLKFDTAESRSGKDKAAGKSNVRDWVKNQLKAAGRRIDSKTLFELTELAGYDMQNLSTETEKLICYTLDKPSGYVITSADINAICSKTLSDRIFDMLDMKLRGRTAQALGILEELFSMKTSAMRILYFMARQYRQALAVKECIHNGLSDAEIMSKTELKDWQLRRIREQIGNVTLKALEDMMEAVADAEYRIKMGDMTDRLAVELLIIR